MITSYLFNVCLEILYFLERDGEESDEDEDLPRFTEEAVKEEEQNDADCGKIEDIEINSHLDEILLKARSIREKAPPAVPKKLSKMSAELSVQTKSASKTNRSTAKSTKVPSSTSNIASLKINSDVAVQQVKVHDTASAKGHMHETKHNKDARDMYEIVDEISSMHLSHPLEFVLPSQSLHKDQSKLLTQLKGRPAYPPSALFNVFVRHFEYWFPMHDLVQGFSVEKCASYMQRTKEKFEKITHSKLQRLNATGDLNNLSEFEKLEIYVMWWNLQRCVIFYEHQMEANDGKLGEEDLYMHDENRCGELMGESQKEYSKSNTIDAVTAKKPHLSPIAVERDRVLLLSLVFNGTLSQLKRHYSKDSCKLHFDYLLDTIVFSTTNVIVKDKFIHFYDGMARSTNSFQHENLEGVQSYSWRIILVDSKAKSLFRQFLYEELERDGLLDWSISSPNVYGALSEMYAPRESDDANVSNSCENFPAAEELNTPRRRRNTCEYCLTRIRSIIRLRAAELNLKRRHFIFSTVILPFVIVLLLVFYCRDIRYPKLELRSSSIGGVGEILVGNGRKVSLNETFTSPPMQLFDFVGTPLSWLGYNVKSDDVFSILYEEYYAHSRNRWSSFVVDDSVEKWVQSSVHISDRSFKGDLNVEQTIDVLNAVKTSVCNMSSSAEFNDQSLLATGADIDPEILSLAEAAFSSRTVRGADESNVTEFCRFLTDMDVKLTYNETRAGDEKKVEASNTSALILQVSQSLEAKVTMLSNMTFFHDTPIFFKELLPYVYASREQSCSVANHSVRGNIDIKASHDYQNNPATNTGYRLFSHPFDDKFSKMKSINPAFVQRGYLGSVIVIMYVLLTSTSIFKFITQCRASGVKSQLHLSGVSPLEYWVANFIVEFSLLLLAFISILVAIYMDGPPISNFCLGATAEHSIIFVLSLCAYAASSVAANYLFACISVDQVTSQLFSLFSSLCGGLFLRLFIALQAHVEPYIIIHRLWLWISPSYAFSSNTYVLFVRYVRQFSSTTGDHEISLITPIVAMCIQVVAYLFLAVVFDTHYYRCTCWLHRLLHQSFVGSYVQDDSSKSSALYSMQSMMIRVTASGSVWDSSKNYVSHANVDEQVPLLSDHRESYHSMQSDNFAALKRLSSLTPNENCEEEINRELSPESFLVNIQNLNLSYQSGILSHSSPVVNHLNMHLQSGERVALMGINGGGKVSNFFRLMSCHFTCLMFCTEYAVQVNDKHRNVTRARNDLHWHV